MPAGVFARFLGYSVGSAAVSAPVAAGSTSLLDPILRGAAYEANIRLGGLLPNIPDFQRLFNQGFINNRDLMTGLASYGAATGAGATGFNERIWNSMIFASQGVAPLNALYVAWRKGELSDEDWELGLRLHTLYKQPWRKVVEEPNDPLPIGLAQIGLLRGYLDVNQFLQNMQAQGITAANDTLALEKLAFAIPGAADLIRFAVREVWDDDVVQRFGYDAEFPPQLEHFLKKQGLSYNVEHVIPGTPESMRLDWPKAYWRSHWQVISPQQAYEAFHRLRPNRIERYRELIPGVRAFELDDLRRILKVADYPEPMRDTLAALSFRPLTRVDVRRMARIGVLDREQVNEAYRDLGYSPQDAEHMTDFTFESNAQSRDRSEDTRAKTAIRNALALGSITPDRAAMSLYPLGDVTTEDMESYERLPGFGKVNRAKRQPWIAKLLATTELRVRTQLVSEQVAAVKKAFLKGITPEATARDNLGIIGITPDRIDQYIAAWIVTQQASTRTATAAETRKFFIAGLIDLDEALSRLKNLGYTDDDADRIMRLVRRDIAAQIARLEEKEAGTARARQAAQARQLRAAEANRRRIIADLNRSATRAQILRFYDRKLMTAAEAKAALIRRGITPEDADDHIAASKRGQAENAEAST